MLAKHVGDGMTSKLNCQSTVKSCFIFAIEALQFLLFLTMTGSVSGVAIRQAHGPIANKIV